jgi:tetratricopeptide (TPR) repeat protein
MTELRLENWQIPSAELGQKNPFPPLLVGRDMHAIEEVCADTPAEMLRNMGYGHLPNIMPYTLQDGYTRELQPREFRVAVLENDILQATFLLELGGRLWSLIHKPTDRELLTVNPTIQFANLALRNAWFSGGVEWNIGTIGHTPFTCSPLFAARVIGPGGLPVLRLYEWERIRGTPFQIDAYLPDGSQVLFIRVRIVNPHNHTVPMYWWSNIAVPETPDTRVLTPAASTYRFNYSKLDIIPVPNVDGLDLTYATNIPQSADFFYHIPKGRRPWIAALDDVGQGLVQVSTERLIGRKLFVWGRGSGGRHWQQFLSPTGQSYIEIQAGLARTQLEHVPMPPGEWTWLEAYGQLQADPAAVHGDDWAQAQQAVESSLERLIGNEDLQTEFARSAVLVDLPPDEILQRGSGWGALERRRCAVDGERAFATAGLLFDDESLGEEQKPWIHLLLDGAFPLVSPQEPPCSFMTHPTWREKLETAVCQPEGDWANRVAKWLMWYHLGVIRHYAGERQAARQAFEESLACERTPWTLRNLALIAGEDGDLEKAVQLYLAAVIMAPHLLPLAIEAGHFLIDAQQAGQWLDLLSELPAKIGAAGRVRLLEAQAALATGKLQRVADFFADAVVIPDLREGELSLSELWYDWQVQRLSLLENTPIDDELRTRVKQEFPVPAGFDFSMVTG